jgi:hypothetical protein
MGFFTMGQMRASKADFVYKLIHTSVTNHFNYDGLGGLHATAKTRNTPLKIPKIQCWKVNVQIGIAMSFSKIRKSQMPPNSVLLYIANTSYGMQGKAIHVTGRVGPQGCETSRLSYFLDNWLTDTPASLYPQEDYRSSFLLEAESTSGP